MSQPPPQFDDFEITITAEEPPAQGANVIVRYADATETGNFSLASVAAAVRQLNDGLALARPSPEVAQAAGATLFDALFANRLFRTYNKAVNLATERGHRLRLRLIAELPTLLAIPWEYLYDRDLERWLALHRDLSLVRALPGAVSAPTPVDGLLRVLVMIADPTDLPQLETAQGWANLEAVADVAAINLIRVAPTYEAMLGALRQHNPHVFHFIGHGTFAPNAQDDGPEAVRHLRPLATPSTSEATQAQGWLAFRKADGTTERISADKLATALADYPSLRLVLLNACKGATTGDRSAFAGVAQKLIQQGLPAVIAMQAPILDDHALRFSQEFYRALADGYTVEQAVGEGRKRIYDVAASWGIPALYFQGGELFAIPVLNNEQKAARLWSKAQGISDPARRRALVDQVMALDSTHNAARKAQQTFEDADEAARLYAVAQSYQRNQQWQEAYRTLELVRRLQPNYRDSWQQLAELKQKLDEAAIVLPADYAAQVQEYRPLLNALKEGRLVPFLGWDVSRLGRPAAELWQPGESAPGVDEIAARLAEPLQPQVAGSTPLLQVSQYTVLLEGQVALYRRLRELYTQPAPPTILHQLLAELPHRLRAKRLLQALDQRFVIFTIAYDDLLERAFVAAGQPYHLFAYRHRFVEQGVENPARFIHMAPDGTAMEVIDPLLFDAHERDDHPILIKLCGLRPTEEPDSVLITEDQFLDYLPAQEIGALLPTRLLRQINRRSFAFFGYSLQPWHFRLIWQRMKFQKRRLYDKSWAIVANPSSIEREFWHSYEITPLVAAPEGVVAYIDAWLKEL